MLCGAFYLCRYVQLRCKRLRPICGNGYYSPRYSLTELSWPTGISIGKSIGRAFNARFQAHTPVLFSVSFLFGEFLVAARRGIEPLFPG